MIERSAEEKRDYVTSILTADRINCRDLVKQRQKFLNASEATTTPVFPARFSVQHARQTEANLSTVRNSITHDEQAQSRKADQQERNTRWVLFLIIIPALSLLRFAVTNTNMPQNTPPRHAYRAPKFDMEEIRSKIRTPRLQGPELTLAIPRNSPVSTSDNEGGLSEEDLATQQLSADLPDPDPSDLVRFDAIIAVRSDPAAAAALAEINADFLRTQRVLRMQASHGLLPKGWIKHYNARVKLYLETVYQLALQHGHGTGPTTASDEEPDVSVEGSNE